jgi:cobalt-zinc-cadmium efflux system protein
MHGNHAHAHESHAAHAHHHAPLGDKRYSIAIALNLGFVAIETVAGIAANSTALLADAAHNLSDVLGLALAGGAAWLAKQAASERRTYGFSKATVLAALANALVLVTVCGGLLWEASRRLFAPEEVAPLIVMAAAAAGVIVNGATAMLFMAGRKHDVNVRGAFLHMLGDAGVSAAVIIAGLAIWLTGQHWIDPVISIAVIALILWSSWDLLRESLDLALDAAPRDVDVSAVRAHLRALPGVVAVHDLHIWAMSANATALTAHLVRPDGGEDAFLAAVRESMAHSFGIAHVTVQIERSRPADCTDCA